MPKYKHLKIALIPALAIPLNENVSPYLPLGLLSIMAQMSDEESITISFVDLNLFLKDSPKNFSSDFYDDCAEYLCNCDFTIIGFSSLDSTIHHTVSLTRRIKKLKPETITLMGGPASSIVSLGVDLFHIFDSLDAILYGEGELIFPQFLRHVKKFGLPSDFPGMLFRTSSKQSDNQTTSQLPDIGKLKIPLYDNLKIENYVYSHRKNEPILRIEEGRGCPFRCMYCSTNNFWQRIQRRKSPLRIIEEMKSLNYRFGITNFNLINDCFNADRKKMLEFCTAYRQSNLTFAWGCSLRIDLIDTQLLDILWESGCRGIFAGIESGSAIIQKIINKNLNLPKTLLNLRHAASKGFYIITSFILGFVEETKADVKLTLDMQHQLMDMGVSECQTNLLTPLYGSDLWKKYKNRLQFDGRQSYITNNKILPEHLPLINGYPDIFCAFHYFKTDQLERTELLQYQYLTNVLNSELI